MFFFSFQELRKHSNLEVILLSFTWIYNFSILLPIKNLNVIWICNYNNTDRFEFYPYVQFSKIKIFDSLHLFYT